jgi:FixJ family two-component response regulator
MDKKRSPQIALYLFYGNAIINLLAQVMNSEVVDYITKPLIMSSLLVYYLVE